MMGLARYWATHCAATRLHAGKRTWSYEDYVCDDDEKFLELGLSLTMACRMTQLPRHACRNYYNPCILFHHVTYNRQMTYDQDHNMLMVSYWNKAVLAKSRLDL